MPTLGLTIGSFDGVHRGHQAIIRNLTAEAHTQGALAVVLTFDPHPLAILRPDRHPLILTPPDEKARLLAALGVDVVITYPFTRTVATWSAETFLTELKNHLGFTQFWVGYDFAMGRNRSGDIPTLRRLGTTMGYTLTVIEPITNHAEIVSSSRIRTLLAEGTS